MVKRARNTKLVLGIGIGFILGSWAGREPYEGLAALTQETVRRQKANGTFNDAVSATKHRAMNLAHTIKTKVPGSSGTSGASVETPGSVSQPAGTYPDPQDLQFGRAAAEKEETLDRMLEQGADPEQLDAIEERLRGPGSATGPRPGNKAQPAEG